MDCFDWTGENRCTLLNLFDSIVNLRVIKVKLQPNKPELAVAESYDFFDFKVFHFSKHFEMFSGLGKDILWLKDCSFWKQMDDFY